MVLNNYIKIMPVTARIFNIKQLTNELIFNILMLNLLNINL